jgi:dethiobiotin synthetase
MRPLFITGIGTDVGKTMVAAILSEALQADYWKPIQAGWDQGTDSEWVKGVIENSHVIVYPEVYRLRLAASPHIAAREEGLEIDLGVIADRCEAICHDGSDEKKNKWLVIEGAGGLLVPLNQREFVLDLGIRLKAKTILVSRNYLGSINHSLLTARAARFAGLDIAGWIFNDQYLNYEEEIVRWSSIPKIASIPFQQDPGKEFILEQASMIRPMLYKMLQDQH